MLGVSECWGSVSMLGVGECVCWESVSVGECVRGQ